MQNAVKGKAAKQSLGVSDTIIPGDDFSKKHRHAMKRSAVAAPHSRLSFDKLRYRMI